MLKKHLYDDFLERDTCAKSREFLEGLYFEKSLILKSLPTIESRDHLSTLGKVDEVNNWIEEK